LVQTNPWLSAVEAQLARNCRLRYMPFPSEKAQ